MDPEIEMCCLCLSLPKENLIDLFSKNEDNLTYFDKISSFLSKLAIVIDVDFDYTICKKCLDTINMIYDFNEKCFNNIKTFTSNKKIYRDTVKKKKLTILNAKLDEIERSKQNESNQNTSTNDETEIEAVTIKTEITDSNFLEENCDTESEIENREYKIEIEEKDMQTEDSQDSEEYFLGFNVNQNNSDAIRVKRYRNYFKENNLDCLENQNDLNNLKKENVESCEGDLENSNEKEEIPDSDDLNLESSKFRISKYWQYNIQNNLPITPDFDLSRIENGENKNELNHEREENLESVEYLVEDSSKYSCNVCYKTFICKSSLKRHELTHMETDNYCTICDKFYKTKYYLTVHQKTHFGVKLNLYKCEICDKSFNKEINLKRHKQIHEVREKLFSCNTCKTKFFYKNSLQRHILNYCRIEEKRYACDQCDLRFKKLDKLVAHKYSHIE